LSGLSDIYPYANTIVCIEDNKLLSQFQYDILFNAKNLQAALNELNSIDYFHTYENAAINNYGLMLDGLMKDVFDLMKEISPNDLIWRIFTLFYDIHNMKLVVKERAFHKRLDYFALDCGGYTLPTIRSAAVREVDNILGNKILTGGFFEALRTKDAYEIDFILDRTYFKTLRHLAAQLNNALIDGFVIERIDLYNVSLYFQSLAAGAPENYFTLAFSGQGSAGLAEWRLHMGAGDLDAADGFNLWQKYKHIWEDAENRDQLFIELDVLIDDYLIEKTKICKVMAFGIEPICAYFYNKLMEIKNVRILLAGKEYNSDTNEIRRRMRIPYAL
jgi:V/A-type H+-transporting ATPase subunit C